MARLILPHENKAIEELGEIESFLTKRGIAVTKWEAEQPLSEESTQESILAAYDHRLGPYMRKMGFKTADVIRVNPKTENIEAIRRKFLSEHTHSEDEVRFFVEGEGDFWFHYDREGSDEVFCVKCSKEDFISVPAEYKHWFDMAPAYTVTAIRIFTNPEGWVANYTGSGIEKKYIEA